jgi:hypothetical protein
MKVFVDENIKQKISHPRFIHLLTSMVALGNWTEPTQRSHKVSRYAKIPAIKPLPKLTSCPCRGQ